MIVDEVEILEGGWGFYIVSTPECHAGQEASTPSPPESALEQCYSEYETPNTRACNDSFANLDCSIFVHKRFPCTNTRACNEH